MVVRAFGGKIGAAPILARHRTSRASAGHRWVKPVAQTGVDEHAIGKAMRLCRLRLVSYAVDA